MTIELTLPKAIEKKMGELAARDEPVTRRVLPRNSKWPSRNQNSSLS